MKTNFYRVIALGLMIFLAGQYGIGADDPVWAPSVVQAVDKLAEEAAKQTGGIGLIAVIEPSVGGEELAQKMIHMVESILQTNHRLTLLNSDNARHVLRIPPDKFVEAEKVKGFFSALGNITYIVIGRLDDDGRFKMYGYTSGNDERSFEIPDIPMEKEEIFKLIVDESMPPIPTYKLVPLNGEIYHSAYNKTGDLVAITTQRGGIYEFDSYRQRLVKTYRDQGPKARIVYGPNAELLVAEDTGILRIITDEKEDEIKAADSPLTAIECSTLGRIYVGYNGGLDVYDLAKQIKLFSFEGVSGDVSDMFLSGDEMTIIAHNSSGIGFWNAVNGKKLGNIPGDFTAAAADTKGEYVAAAIKGQVHLYSAKTKENLGTFKFPGQPGSDSDITSLRFSPQGHYILAGNNSGLVMTLHVDAKMAMHCMESHFGPVATVNYGPDGQFISGGIDSQLLFYEVQKEPSGSLEVNNNVNENVAITLNGSIPHEGPIVTAMAKKVFRNLQLGTIHVVIQIPSDAIIAFSGQRSANVVITRTGNSITLTRQAIPILDLVEEGRKTPTSLGITTSGLLSIAHGAGEPTKSDSGYADIVLLNINTGLSTLLGAPEIQHRKNINDSIWFGELLITAADDGLWIWKDNNPTVLDSERADTISTDGKYMVSSSAGTDAKLWEREGSSFKLVRKISGEKAMFHQGSVLSVKGNEIIRTTPEGERLPVFPVESSEKSVIIQKDVKSIRPGYGNVLLIARTDNFIELRNAGPGTPLFIPGTIAIQNAQSVFAAQQNGDILQFNTATGHQEEIIFAHNREVTDMLFKENMLITASRDGSTKILNIETGREISKFVLYDDRQKTFIKDGRFYGDHLYVLRNGKRL